MHCADTVGHVCSYLQKRELVELSNASRLCRRGVARHLSERERNYYVNPCLREDLVELVPPPNQILALRFVEEERQLLVLVRVNSPIMGDEAECCLYVQEALPEGMRSDHRIALPGQFGLPTSHVHFEGNRFLCCTTREGQLSVFDCVAEAPLELPFGYDGFRASPNGRRCLVDFDRQLFYCCSDTSITVGWEGAKVALSHGSSGSSNSSGSWSSRRQSSATAAAAVSTGRHNSNDISGGRSRPPQLRARLSVERPLLTYPLGNSSSAWRSFWVGESSVLYAHEQGVVLLTESTTAATAQHYQQQQQMAVAAAFESVELVALASIASGLAHSGASAVANLTGAADEYAIFNCRDSTLHSVWAPFGAGAAGVKVGQTSLSSLIAPRSCIIKEVRVAVPRSTYMIFLNDHVEDRLLLVTADLTLSRWIAIGEPSALTLLVGDGIVISAPLPAAGLWDRQHPMVETVEGGVGSVFSFSEEQQGFDLLDPTLTSIAVVSRFAGLSSALRDECLGGLPWYKMELHSFNGVEFLSWAALGVVSASLVWTVSALIYNGWWLHLQLLFWGKVN